jgi:hypothetical protein
MAPEEPNISKNLKLEILIAPEGQNTLGTDLRKLFSFQH